MLWPEIHLEIRSATTDNTRKGIWIKKGGKRVSFKGAEAEGQRGERVRVEGRDE